MWISRRLITWIGRKTNEGIAEVYAVLLDKCKDTDYRYLHAHQRGGRMKLAADLKRREKPSYCEMDS